MYPLSDTYLIQIRKGYSSDIYLQRIGNEINPTNVVTHRRYVSGTDHHYGPSQVTSNTASLSTPTLFCVSFAASCRRPHTRAPAHRHSTDKRSHPLAAGDEPPPHWRRTSAAPDKKLHHAPTSQHAQAPSSDSVTSQRQPSCWLSILELVMFFSS